MKKRLILLMALFIVISSINPVSASSFKYFSFDIDGEILKTSVRPYVINGSPMVSVRDVCLSFGIPLVWDNKVGSATIKYMNNKIVYFTNSNITYVNNIKEYIYSKTAVSNGKLMVPADSLFDALGLKYTWDKVNYKFSASFGVDIVSVYETKPDISSVISSESAKLSFVKQKTDNVNQLRKMAAIEGVIFKEIDAIDYEGINNFYKYVSTPGDINSLKTPKSIESKAKFYSTTLAVGGFKYTFKPTNFYQYKNSVIVMGVDSLIVPDYSSFLYAYIVEDEKNGYVFNKYTDLNVLYNSYKKDYGGIAIFIKDSSGWSVVKALGK